MNYPLQTVKLNHLAKTMFSKLIFLLLLLPLSSSAQTIDSAWMVNHYVKKELYIGMRDKVRLFTSIYMPADSGQKTHPILLLRTPYSCAPYGKAWIPFWKTYLKAYFKEGYIIAWQDVRGRYMSEGNFVNIRPFNPNKKTNKDIDEASDSYDTIDWLIRHIAGNNGKAGALGTSYGGFYTMMAGLSGHPAMRAISPQAPVTDWFAGDDIHHNGAFMLMDMFDFYVGWGFGLPRPKPAAADGPVWHMPTKDAYAFYLQTGPLPAFTKIADQRRVGFWDELMQHPNYDGWWQARNDRNYAAKLPTWTASLVVGGLFDAEDCYGAINLYQAIEHKAKNNNKFVYGPWRHGQWGSPGPGDRLGNIRFGSSTNTWYTANIEVPFFNYYLKGEGSVEPIPEATVFFTGENRWHKLPQWPPKDIVNTSLYMGKGGALSSSAPTAAPAHADYTSDPAKPVPYNDGIHQNRTVEYMDDDQRFAATRPDVLSFETGPLTRDITLAGPLTADLWVSLSTSDADFVVKLIDVFPDNFKYSDTDKYIMGGYQMLVRGDVMRGRYRNSLSRPEAFVPGKPTEVKYTLNDIAHTFKKGHRIMVQVQSSWFPLVDRNPQQFIDIYHAKNSDFVKSQIKIYLSGNNASRIMVPVLK